MKGWDLFTEGWVHLFLGLHRILLLTFVFLTCESSLYFLSIYSSFFFFNFAGSFSGYLGLLSLMENFSVREVFFLKLA
jgi:E3 ubiquitin-protein ligase DOA10